MPPEEPDPIGFLLAHGWTRAEIAVAVGLQTTDVLAKYQSGQAMPRYGSAVLLAEVYGWRPGEVMDCHAAIVRRAEEAKKERSA